MLYLLRKRIKRSLSKRSLSKRAFVWLTLALARTQREMSNNFARIEDLE
jgi:hypothetical protein